jgi:mannose-6-phosphate isomerase-like protein (cupin superfamily)
MTQSVSGVFSSDPKDDEDWLRTRPGELCRIRVPAADTQGRYSIVEIVSNPGDGTSLHMHENEDQLMIVLEGAARIAYGEKTFDAAAGTAVTLLRGIPHAWGNRSDSLLRILEIGLPGGGEEILRLIAASDPADLAALAKKFRVRRIGRAPF